MQHAASKPLVYLAGPYSKPEPMVNIHAVCKLADGLLDICVPVIPHTLTGMWQLVSPKPEPTWLEYDLHILAACHALLRFGGESSGAEAEVAFARESAIPVFYTQRKLRTWVLAGWTMPRG